MLALSSGAMVACFTLGSILRTTSPRRWIPRENRGLLISQRSSSRFWFQTTATSCSTFFLTTSGCPLCPAITYTSSHSTSPAKQTVGLFAAMPDRNCVVMHSASSGLRSSSWAIWRWRDLIPSVTSTVSKTAEADDVLPRSYCSGHRSVFGKPCTGSVDAEVEFHRIRA